MTEPNTGYYALVVADSINEYGIRLTTLEVCFPRFILAEFNTHRVLSRNSASSRAIPVAKQLERIKNHPFVPSAFPINKPGMSATEYLYPGDSRFVEAVDVWLDARDAAIRAAELLVGMSIHKQTANRLLEPFMWHTVVVTATEWENFFNLRISPHAQPEINKIAVMMKDIMNLSEPQLVPERWWHLPYIDDEDRQTLPYANLPLISAGRCAAVTLLNQKNKDSDKDLARAEGLIKNGHMSPLEHPAQSCYTSSGNSNFDPAWKQLRKKFPNEKVFIGE